MTGITSGSSSTASPTSRRTRASARRAASPWRSQRPPRLQARVRPGRAAAPRRPASIEIDVLKEPIGKQDQYIAAYGGDQRAHVQPRRLGRRRAPAVARRGHRRSRVEPRHLLLGRRARGVARCSKEQAKTITENKDAARRSGCIASRQLGYETKRILLDGQIDAYGEMLHEHWTNKRKLASNMADSDHRRALRGGAQGRRHRRKADGRGRRRLLHVLRAGRATDVACTRRSRRAASARCASASTSTARGSWPTSTVIARASRP